MQEVIALNLKEASVCSQFFFVFFFNVFSSWQDLGAGCFNAVDYYCRQRDGLKSVFLL